MKAVCLALLCAMIMVGSAAAQGRTLLAENGRKVNSSEFAQLKSALEIYDMASRTALGGTMVPTVGVASKAAMISTGSVWQDNTLAIKAVVHTQISANSVLALRVRRYEATYIEWTTVWGSDMFPGDTVEIKKAGGGSFIDTTKQYEFVVFNPNTGLTSVDFVPVITGNGPFISGSPTTGAAAGSTYLVFNLQAVPGDQINAVVVSGVVLPRGAYNWSPAQAGTGNNLGSLSVNLASSGVCFDNAGDVSITIVKEGQSDTTSFRVSPMPQWSCGGKG